MIIDFWMNWMRANRGRKGSTFGWPEPYESLFERVNDNIKAAIDRGTKDADVESDARRSRTAPSNGKHSVRGRRS